MQASPGAQGLHLVLYDGVCGLCHRLVQFLLRYDRRAAFDFASLQSGTGRAMVERSGGNRHGLNSFYIVANYRTPAARVMTRSRAALFVAGELGWPWKLGCVLRAIPSRMLDRGYDFIARHRYRVFGRSEQCLVPQWEFRNRFVE
jgi:predicted DCC family thiol-disulfide oxidoreductase YuxK